MPSQKLLNRMNKLELDFQIGDLVECVNTESGISEEKCSILKAGSTYIVRDIRKEHYGVEFYVYLEGIGEENDGWHFWRFRKIEPPSRKFVYSRMLRFEV